MSGQGERSQRSQRRCRRCQARLRWVTTAAGKRMPLNWKPSQAGNVALVRTTDQRIVAIVNPGPDVSGPRYTRHGADCREAESPGGSAQRAAKPVNSDTLFEEGGT